MVPDLRSRTLRFAMFGAGFWSRFQLHAWREIEGVECVAIYNRTREKAEDLARSASVRSVYDDPGTLLREESLDFVDIVTAAETHACLVALCLRRGVPVICQKPMAPALQEATAMLEESRAAGVPLYIHENFRWQTPIRALKAILDSSEIGAPFRARIRMVSAFPVFENQPFLRHLERFLLIDIGNHILDVARFLFGEIARVFCHTQRVRPDILGEDVATVVLETASGATIVCEMGYPGAPLENDCFPQTLAFIEGEHGSIELEPDYSIRTTTVSGTRVQRFPPRHYSWADPRYDVTHASIVPCHANLVAGLRGERMPETTAEDNYKTMRLVFACYDSAASGEAVRL